MVKKKKIIKRVTALGVVALLLLVAVAPAISPTADALPALPGVDSSGNSVPGSVAYLPIPLDRFSNDTASVSFENPFYSIALGENRSDGFSSSADLVIYNYADSNSATWEFWKLGHSEVSEDFYFAYYGLETYTSANSLDFSMLNSSQFVVTVSDLNCFLELCIFDVLQYFNFNAVVSISGYYPHQAENKSWLLTPFEAEVTKSLQCFEPGTTRVELPAFTSESLPGNLDVDGMVIIDNITVSVSYYVPLQYLYLYSNTVEGGDSVLTWDFIRFSMPVKAEGFACNLRDFWHRYPCQTYLLDGEPGSLNFDLSAFLRQSIGGFFQTEIIPNLTFGTLFAVAISVSLVGILVKRLG